MDYEKKYIDLTSGLNKCIPDISDEFPNANGFEKAVTAMRQRGWTYTEIQKKLGMPSKKDIRNALLNTNPDLIDNSQKKVIYNNLKSRLAGILNTCKQWEFDLDELGLSQFEDINGELWITDEFGDRYKFDGLDERTKKSILINIVSILGLKIEI